MNENPPDARKETEASDQQFFQALEELFIRLRGSPLLLSPADWKTAQGWRQKGIPMDIIAGVLKEIFERQPTNRGRGGIRSLRYFEPAVEKAWLEARELGIGAPPRPAEALDVPSRLAALADAIVGEGPLLDHLRERILSLSGSAREVESALAELDQEFIDEFLSKADVGVRRQIDYDVREAETRLAARLPADEIRQTRELLQRRAVRKRLGIPVLSLFGSPRPADSPAD